MLYTLSLYNAKYQLYLSKIEIKHLKSNSIPNVNVKKKTGRLEGYKI